MPFQIATTAFPADGMIPKKFTCEGPDVSPGLSWKDAPAGTQSYALIADDPDAPAGTWVHWVIYNVPANTTELPEGIDKKDELASGALQGRKLGITGRVRRRGSRTATTSSCMRWTQSSISSRARAKPMWSSR